ncbi:acyltransferase family protein [Dermatobacter hominis]|uniref:acyltransferase family protein n=1 Tax=Dermatobacter hominis TaxID=2884263 RepID=UPI001D107E74|nr:acyltransferase [Dermatobacter hominis]UDY34639.1 acyltransferase [Dermatobacter hominis]
MTDAAALTDADRLIKVQAPRLGHIPSFDGFRGIFVLQVVLYHAGVTAKLLPGSPIIIDWFFVASGFLITSLLLDEQNRSGGIDMRRFYTRRALRLFPAMYAMIGIFTVLMLAVQIFAPNALEDAGLWWVESLAASLYVYFLVAAFFPATIGAIGHTWSLTVEEQFYFFWPMLLRRSLKRGTRRSDRNLIIGCLVFIALFVTLRMSLQHVVTWDGIEARFADQDQLTWQGVVYRIAAVRPDMIVCGCLAAFVARRIPRPVPDHVRRVIAVLGALGWVMFAGVLLFASRFPFFTMFGSIGYQLALWALVPLVLDLYFRQESLIARGLAWHRAQWFGQRSYGIYLWHIPVLLPFLAAIESSYGARKLGLGLVAAALGVCAGLLSFRYVERRFLHIKETRFTAPQDRLRSEMAAGDVADPGPGRADGPIEPPPYVEPPSPVDHAGPSTGADQRP